MSLQIWLPLDGDTRNLGLCNTPLTASNVTFADGGKIGAKYLSGGSITIPAAASAKIFNGSHMTFAFWLYPIGDSGSGQVMGQSAMGAGNNRMYTIFQYNTPTKLHLSWQSETSNTTFLGYGGTEIFDANKWTHLCITYNGTKALIYKNGEYFGQAVGTSTRTAFNYDFPIYGSTIRKLNDVRIYDHVLSEKEVKEIAKGLILHYKLDNNGIGGENIVPNTTWAIREYTYPSSGYNDKWSATTIVIPNGDKYVLSFWAKSTVAGDKVRAHYYSPNTTTTCISSQGVTKSASDGNMDFVLSTQWEHYWVIYNQTATTAVKHLIFPRMSSQNNTSVTCTGTGTVSVRGVKFEAGDIPTAWCPAGAQTKVYDCSGYKNDGTITGSLNISPDTRRYLVSTKWPTQTTPINYITCPALTLPGDQITMSLWFKWGGNSGGDGYHILFATGSEYEFSIPSNGTARCGLVIGGTRQCNNYGTSGMLSDGKWHMITQTYNGANRIVYVDGVVKNNTAYTGALASGPLTFYIGRYSSGNYAANNCWISDVRLYTTALSAAAVKELYETSASVDEAGNAYARELVEQ